ncbi:MAG: amidohydrolase [Calditrichaceae bacterium]
MRQKFILLLFFITTGILCCCNQKSAADLVITDAKIVTLDNRLPQAQALAVKGDRIAAIGSNDAIAEYMSAGTEVLNLNGQLVIPGIIEGHAHFLSLGEVKMNLDLSNAGTWDEIIEIVKGAVHKVKPGEWIIGRGLHQEMWESLPEQTVEGYPIHSGLSRISPDNPVMLTHASGHAIFANAKAMTIAGVSKSTADPKGGHIVRIQDGQPSGIFLENAETLVENEYEKYRAARTPEEKEAEIIKMIQLASEECLKNGITSFQDAGQPFEIIDIYKKLADQDKLNTRLWVMINEDNHELESGIDAYKIVNYGNYKLTVRAIKRYMDGALGSRGAWMLKPYSDMPSTTGLNTTPLDEFKETARFAIEHDFQLCTHAIGDRANREVLNIYENIFKQNHNKTNLRWRIEHAQHLHPDDIPRFSKSKVIASMQGIHCISDGPWVHKRIGEERAKEGAYVWKKLLESGAVVSNGTDAPVEDIDPIANYYALVTRKMKNGKTFYPEQCLSRMEALEVSTLNCAYAAFEEDIKGSLTPGKLADMVVLSKDILTVPDEEIKNTKILYTILGGKIKYQLKNQIE